MKREPTGMQEEESKRHTKKGQPLLQMAPGNGCIVSSHPAASAYPPLYSLYP